MEEIIMTCNICLRRKITNFLLWFEMKHSRKWSRHSHFLVFAIFLAFLLFWYWLGENPVYPTRPRVLFKHKEVTDNTLIDLEDFRYIINNNVCNSDGIDFILMIHSHPSNEASRSSMRDNIPKEDLLDIGMRRVFLFGRAEWDDQEKYKSVPQRRIVDENEKFGDIIQGNFKEHYRNLTYKHTMGLKWVLKYCSQASFIIKMDDDIIVDLYHFRNLLKYRYFHRKNLILGLLESFGRPIRNQKSKWYVTEEEYPGHKYPPFLSGWAYAMTMDAARKIVNVTADFPYFWIDDVHLTGTLAAFVGVHREPLNHLYTMFPNHLKCCIELTNATNYVCDFIVGPSDGDISLMTKLLSHARSCFLQSCQKRNLDQRVEKMCVTLDTGNALGVGHGEVIELN